MEEIIDVTCENSAIEELDAYSEVALDLSKLPDVVKPLMLRANETLAKINKMLYTALAFINVIKAAVPEHILTAVLTDEQKGKIASGALRLMTKKDGSLLATLIDPVTKHTVSNIPLQNIKISPEIGQAMTNYSYRYRWLKLPRK